MFGPDIHQDALFSTASPETRVRKVHPLRPIRQMVDFALKLLAAKSLALYSAYDHESIPQEKLLRAQLLLAFPQLQLDAPAWRCRRQRPEIDPRR